MDYLRRREQRRYLACTISFAVFITFSISFMLSSLILVLSIVGVLISPDGSESPGMILVYPLWYFPIMPTLISIIFMIRFNDYLEIKFINVISGLWFAVPIITFIGSSEINNFFVIANLFPTLLSIIIIITYSIGLLKYKKSLFNGDNTHAE
ncbi:MAG: hypothetical protein A2Y17_09530 [Clostridiales bacterium GWF2_38_85]|nr:MAG: hypothetical protein A2Y17_09530 [Clostridiales bacterium GWF2_38_85]HBL83562.1 hypothetical protein [Clostridiales bacterium]